MSTTTDSKAPLRQVKRVQFGILSPDEIVSSRKLKKKRSNAKCEIDAILKINCRGQIINLQLANDSPS